MPLSGEQNQILIFGVVFLIFKIVNLFIYYRMNFLVRYQVFRKEIIVYKAHLYNKAHVLESEVL